MGKTFKTFLVSVLLIAGMFMFSAAGISATSWVKLEPEEVDKRAEIVVLGKYDFSKSADTKSKIAIFSPVVFKVDKYYRGSGTEEITTGVDMFDMGWVSEAQDKGASFLLFLLPNTDDISYLLPVGGPNGMIQVVDNKAMTGNKDEEAYFNDILNKKADSSDFGVSDMVLISFGILIFLFTLITFILIRKIRKNE